MELGFSYLKDGGKLLIVKMFYSLKYRKLEHKYERKIAQDFQLHKLPEEEWPECDYCLSKLHQPPPGAADCTKHNDKTLAGYYMKCPEMGTYSIIISMFINYLYRWNIYPKCY